MRHALVQHAERGKALHQAPFGFRRDAAAHWEVDPALWPVVHAIFALYLTTSLLAQLGREVAQHHGVTLSASTLLQVLTGRIYVDGQRVQMIAGQPYAIAPVILADPVPVPLFRRGGRRDGTSAPPTVRSPDRI